VEIVISLKTLVFALLALNFYIHLNVTHPVILSVINL